MDDDENKDYKWHFHAFEELVKVCNDLPHIPPVRVMRKEDGTLSARYSNKTPQKVVSEDGSFSERYIQRKAQKNSEAWPAAADLVAALLQGDIVENTRYATPGGYLSDDEHKRLADAIEALNKTPDRPLVVGDNLTVRVDRSGNAHVDLVPPANLDLFTAKLFQVCCKIEMDNEALHLAFGSAPEKGVVEGQPLNWDIVCQIREAKFSKVRNQDALTVDGADAQITPYRLKESGMFTPYHINDFDGSLAIRRKSDKKILSIDPKTFKPQDPSLKPEDYEWLMRGNKLLTFMAKNKFKFTGSARYLTDQDLLP